MLTVGHGTASERDFGDRLVAAGVEVLVDVRTAPGSRRHPHFGRDQLERWLPERGVDYRWEPRLGGFRRAATDSPDTALCNDAFRGYAGHMRTPEFRVALADLVASEGRTAIVCSESVWWRCHRRLVADHLVLVEGLSVHHLMPDERLAEHRPTDGVRLDPGGDLVYDGGQVPTTR